MRTTLFLGNESSVSRVSWPKTILDDELKLICNKRKVTNEENKKVNGMFYFIANKTTNNNSINDVPASMWQDIYNTCIPQRIPAC